MSDETSTTATTGSNTSSQTIALLFPGQGSQSVGMGRELYDNFAVARQTFEEANDALEFSLSKLIFDSTGGELNLTENTQPAILTVSIAAYRVLAAELQQRELCASMAAGHSLGEYAAHVAAGTFRFADAVRTVRARGRAMQSAVPAGLGAMAAVLGLDSQRINDICASVSDELTGAPPDDPADPMQQAAPALDALQDPANPASTPAAAASRVSTIVAPANMNSPEQTVISGEKHAVEVAAERCKQAGAKRTVMLPVSAPFHCALMQPAQVELGRVLEHVPFVDPMFPVACNVDARMLTRGPEVRDALIRQVTGAVRWVECIEQLKSCGATLYIEVGPGKVLSGLNRAIDRSLTTTNVEDQASLEKTLALLAG